MNINITPKAIAELERKKYNEYEYTIIKMVNHSCSGPVLKLAASKEIDEDDYIVEEKDGYKFAIKKSEAEMFDNFKIDYESEGLAKGIRVKALDSRIGQCFPRELQ